VFIRRRILLSRVSADVLQLAHKKYQNATQKVIAFSLRVTEQYFTSKLNILIAKFEEFGLICVNTIWSIGPTALKLCFACIA